MKLSLNTLLWLVALAFLFIALVFFSKTLQGIPQLQPNSKSSSDPSSASVVAATSSYTGILKKIDEGTLYGTHVLIDRSGKVLAYLQSRKIDLKILEGSEVVVEGQRQRVVEAGIPLLSVERISFR